MSNSAEYFLNVMREKEEEFRKIRSKENFPFPPAELLYEYIDYSDPKDREDIGFPSWGVMKKDELFYPLFDFPNVYHREDWGDTSYLVGVFHISIPTGGSYIHKDVWSFSRNPLWNLKSYQSATPYLNTASRAFVELAYVVYSLPQQTIDMLFDFYSISEHEKMELELKRAKYAERFPYYYDTLLKGER